MAGSTPKQKQQGRLHETSDLSRASASATSPSTSAPHPANSSILWSTSGVPLDAYRN
jgi:hypothetical protein